MESCEWKVKFLKDGKRRALEIDGAIIAMMEVDENGLWYLVNPKDGKRTKLVETKHVCGESVVRYTLWNYAIYELILQTPKEKVTKGSPYGSIKDNEADRRGKNDPPIWNI